MFERKLHHKFHWNFFTQYLQQKNKLQLDSNPQPLKPWSYNTKLHA